MRRHLLPGLLPTIIAALLLLGALRLLPGRQYDNPEASRRPPSPAAAGTAVVPEGVTLAGYRIAGWRHDDVRLLLEELAERIRTEPVDARLDPATKGLVPPLNGLALDVEATLARIRSAGRDSRVELVLREVPPAVQPTDLPPAPVYRGNPAKRAVTLLINVAWGQEHLPEMLRVLADHGVEATFFLVGQWVEKHPHNAAAIAAAGHEIANHGYSPAEFAALSREQVGEEITRAERAILAATGRKPRYFSPHKGAISPALLQAARDKGYETILWSLDTVDWKKPGVDWMVERILSGAHNGALILMHPTEQTVRALAPIITGLRTQGLDIVPLGTLLSPSPPQPAYTAAELLPSKPSGNGF